MDSMFIVTIRQIGNVTSRRATARDERFYIVIYITYLTHCGSKQTMILDRGSIIMKGGFDSRKISGCQELGHERRMSFTDRYGVTDF